MSSSDEEDPNMKPDKEKKMYVQGMDPKAGPIHLTPVQASTQKFYAKTTRAAGFREPTQSVVLSKDAQTFASMEEADKVTTRSRAVVAPASPMSGSKAASSQREPADIPTKGQQVPNYPIVPYSGDGSRAGSFRSGGGLGSTDTCVANGHPSKT
jgi:hypothetical protein